jgi:N6-adenosine-specific RNA methylase IME4
MFEPFPDKKYQVIVVDPPWNLRKLTHSARPNQVTMDYKTVSLEEIRNVKIGDLADENCWCFLWTIQKYLFDAKPILEGWGFNYLLTMVWEKTYGISAGMPLFGFRWNAEFIMVGYKKKPELWPNNRPLIPVVFSAENIKHSQKPDRFYKMIEILGEPRIDVFARNTREGWDVWGDEINYGEE